MVMVNGMNLTTQEYLFYARGGDYRRVALTHYQQRMRDQQEQTQPGPQQPSQSQQMGPPAPQPSAEEQRKARLPQPVQRAVERARQTIEAKRQELPGQKPQQTSVTSNLKEILSGPEPPRGAYQEKPGGQIRVMSEEENARQSALRKIQETEYKQKFGYVPPDTGYQKEIQTVDQEIIKQKQYLGTVQTASQESTFTINNKQYSKQEALDYINKSINELTQSKAYLERYREAGYVLEKTDQGYSFKTPKASEVVSKIYGGERPDVYIAQELRTLGFGVLFAGGQDLLSGGGTKSLQAHKEETAQAILGTTRQSGESIEAYTARFWTSPEVAVDVYLPLVTLGGSKLISTAGRVLAPELAEVGSKLAGFSSKGARLVETIPESVRYVGFRAGFTGKTILYETGRVLTSPVGQQVAKYGFYGAMEGPTLVETARERPELFGARLGQSLTRYEVATGSLETGGRILQKGFIEMREPIYVSQRPITERLGLRPMDEEATQPIVPGKLKGRLSEMTARDIEEADIKFAQSYKETPARLTAEERELQGLSESFNKQLAKGKKGLSDFIKNKEGMQPILPRVGPREEVLIGEKRGFNALVKGEETTQPLPGVRPKVAEAPARKEIFFSDGTGRVEVIGAQPKGTATIIEEFPRTGGLEIGEGIKTGQRLEIPASYEKEVTRLGEGKYSVDVIEAKPGTLTPTGKLIVEEPKKGNLTIAEFKPGERQQFEGLMGVRRVEPVSRIGLGKNEPSLMESGIIPETKEQAIKSQKAIIESERNIVNIPKTQEEAIARIQNYYGEPVKKEGTVALRIGDKTKLYTKEDIADFTGLTKPEPSIKQGNYALDFKGEEQIFREEIPVEDQPYFKDIDIGKIGEARKETYAVNVKGQVKRFSGEDLLGLGKGELKPRPQRYSKEQLQRAVYSPGASAEYYGKQLRKTMRVKIDEPVSIGTRPEEGWQKYLGERQDAKIIIEKEKQYVTPELAKPLKLMKEKPTSPSFTKVYTTEDITKGLRYEPGPRPDNFLLRKPSEPFRVEGEQIGKQSYVIENEPLIKGTSTTPTEIFESPDIRYVTVERPLTREEVKLLSEIGDIEQPTRVSSTYWENIRPKMQKGAHLLTRIQEQDFASGEKGLLAGIQATGSGLRFASDLEGRGPQPLTSQGLGLGVIQENLRDQEQRPDVLRGQISRQRYNELVGMRQDQGTEQQQKQRTMQLSSQLQEQLTRQEQAQKYDELRLNEPLYDTTTDSGLFPGETRTDITFPPFIPRKKKKDEEEEEKPKEKPGEQKAYDVYVKERGMYHGKVLRGYKFVKVNKKPLSESDALALGGEITDTSRAVSFRLKRVKGRPERPDFNVKPFSDRQYKFYRKGETIIEKPEYRMDTPGELEQVSALGQEERRRQGTESMSLMQTIGSTRNKGTRLLSRKQKLTESGAVRTPKNRSMRLLSSDNKLKETNIFRRKKGGKNNDYY